jgi:hypothetical protein
MRSYIYTHKEVYNDYRVIYILVCSNVGKLKNAQTTKHLEFHVQNLTLTVEKSPATARRIEHISF